MANERTQHYGNHAQYTPLFHFFASPLAIAYLVWAIMRAMRLRDAESHFDLLGAVALVGIVFSARLMALKVQDRVIRLEQRLRLSRILPADLQPHVLDIRPGHLVALRFASDEEVPELVRAVIADPSITPNAIKQRVRNWQADFFRA